MRRVSFFKKNIPTCLIDPASLSTTGLQGFKNSGTLSRGQPAGLTLLEVVVVIGIIAILAALLLPAIQQARGSARNLQCRANIRQLGIALHSYHDSFKAFPSGNVNRFSMFVAMLPHLEQAPLYQRIDFTSPESDENTALRATRIGILICPSDAGLQGTFPVQPTNYVGNEGTGVQHEGRFNGFFQPIFRHPRWGGGMLGAEDFADGLSNTVGFSEVLVGNGSPAELRNVWVVNPAMQNASQLDQFANACQNTDLSGIVGDPWNRGAGWMRAETGPTLYNHLQTPNRRSCTNGGNVLTGAYPATSQHFGGVNVCLGDGSSRFVSSAISRDVWRAIGTRSKGDIVSDF